MGLLCLAGQEDEGHVGVEVAAFMAFTAESKTTKKLYHSVKENLRPLLMLAFEFLVKVRWKIRTKSKQRLAFTNGVTLHRLDNSIPGSIYFKTMVSILYLAL